MEGKGGKRRGGEVGSYVVDFVVVKMVRVPGSEGSGGSRRIERWRREVEEKLKVGTWTFED